MIDFEELRFDKRFHLGLGDVRLTIAMQDEIEEEVEYLNNLLKLAYPFVNDMVGIASAARNVEQLIKKHLENYEQHRISFE